MLKEALADTKVAVLGLHEEVLKEQRAARRPRRVRVVVQGHADRFRTDRGIFQLGNQHMGVLTVKDRLLELSQTEIRTDSSVASTWSRAFS